MIHDSTRSPATTFTDNTVTPRTRYVYRVKARNSVGLSPESSLANAETPVVPVPTGLTVSSVDHESVTLTWDDPGDSAIVGYQILRRSLDGTEYGDDLGDEEFVVIHDDTESSATTFTDASVSARTRYAYTVKARNLNGFSESSSSIDAVTSHEPGTTPPTLPAAPTGLTVSSVDHASVTLTWDDPGDGTIVSYHILRRSVGGSAGLEVIESNTGSSATSYTDTSVTPGTSYVYMVKARNSWGLSVVSNSVNTQTTATPVPSQPTGLSVSVKTYEEVTLKWQASGDETVTSYQILRRSLDGPTFGDNLGSTEYVVIHDNTGSSVPTYTDTSVAPLTRYGYRIRARNSYGLSEISSIINVTTSEANAPAAPTGLTVSSTTYESVTLSWNASTNSTIRSYQILRRSLDGPDYGDNLGSTEFVVIHDDTGSSANTFTDTSVTARTRYVYQVKARNSVGLSPESNNANGETPQAAVPAAPAGLAASSVTHYRVTIGWDDPSNTTIRSYQILRRSLDGDEYGDNLGSTEFVVIHNNTRSSATTYSDYSVSPRTRYVYQVKARNSVGLSAASSSANGESSQATVPAAPTGLTVSSDPYYRVYAELGRS